MSRRGSAPRPVSRLFSIADGPHVLRRYVTVWGATISTSGDIGTLTRSVPGGARALAVSDVSNSARPALSRARVGRGSRFRRASVCVGDAAARARSLETMFGLASAYSCTRVPLGGERAFRDA